MRLREGVSVTRAAEVARQVLQGLGTLTGADANVTKYASWVNSCESRLREVLVEPDLSHGLHSPRFGLIFGNDLLFDFTVASQESARWHAALYAEIEHQRHRLQQVGDQLDQLVLLARRPGTPLVYDTNSLMHYEPPTKILWDEVVEGPVRLVVPLVVIDELDRKKYSGTKKMAYRAGVGGRAVQEIVGSAGPGAAVEVRRGVTLEVLLDERGHRRAAAADDEVIERARLMQQIVEAPVAVLTHDLGLQLRAELAGLSWTTLPDRYKKPEPFGEE